MNQLTIQGYRVGMNNNKTEDYYTGHNRELRERARKLKKTNLIIRAERCMRTGKVFEKEYKKARKHLSNKTILEKYNEIKEDLGLSLVVHKCMKTKVCLICGEEFIPTGRCQKYCRECRGDVRRKQKKENIKKWRKINLLPFEEV